MPIKPGRHNLEMHLAKPRASSLLGYIGSFFGYQPELLQPKVLASTAGNNCWVFIFCLFKWTLSTYMVDTKLSADKINQNHKKFKLFLVIRMETSGTAFLTFNVVAQNFLKLGYDYGGSKVQ